MRPPQRPPPTPALVQALITHYRTERAKPGQPVEVGFFHGGMPDDALLAAATPHAIRVSCSPVDLTRQQARRLLEAQVATVELEVLTFDNSTLKGLRRGYYGEMVQTQLASLRERGVRLGVTLSPGLPGGSHAQSVADIDHLIDASGMPLVDFVRLNPALALQGARVEDWVRDGQWTPMHLGEAVTTLVEMMNLLQSHEIDVARVGLQVGPDLPGAVVAGPEHPNLRQLVEVRRFFQRMKILLQDIPEGSGVRLAVNPADLSWAKGTANENIRRLRALFALNSLTVEADVGVRRGLVECRAGAPR